MKDKNYFKAVVSLFEAASEQEQLQNTTEPVDEEVVETEVIEEQNPDEEELAQQEPEGELDDAAYLNNQEQQVSIADSRKLVKLFNLFDSLFKYCKNFNDCLENVDLDVIDYKNIEKLSDLKGKLNSMEEKIGDYLKDIFKDETYERALYAYILFRTELLTIVKTTRDLLELNKVNEEETQTEK